MRKHTPALWLAATLSAPAAADTLEEARREALAGRDGTAVEILEPIARESAAAAADLAVLHAWKGRYASARSTIEQARARYGDTPALAQIAKDLDVLVAAELSAREEAAVQAPEGGPAAEGGEGAQTGHWAGPVLESPLGPSP